MKAKILNEIPQKTNKNLLSFSVFGAFQSVLNGINSLQTQLTGIKSNRTPDGAPWPLRTDNTRDQSHCSQPGAN